MQEKLYTIQEAADMCNISVRAIQRQMGEGNLPYARIGRLVRFERKDIDDFIQSKKVTRHKNDNISALVDKALKDVI